MTTGLRSLFSALSNNKFIHCKKSQFRAECQHDVIMTLLHSNEPVCCDFSISPTEQHIFALYNQIFAKT
ncbi:MAG: hypothetical protein MJE68_13375, partial [Proteobacteria bacterium]|nr:hypothetical protein [Pseudomonadota bacterium]